MRSKYGEGTEGIRHQFPACVCQHTMLYRKSIYLQVLNMVKVLSLGRFNKSGTADKVCGLARGHKCRAMPQWPKRNERTGTRDRICRPHGEAPGTKEEGMEKKINTMNRGPQTSNCRIGQAEKALALENLLPMISQALNMRLKALGMSNTSTPIGQDEILGLSKQRGILQLFGDQ